MQNINDEELLYNLNKWVNIDDINHYIIGYGNNRFFHSACDQSFDEKQIVNKTQANSKPRCEKCWKSDYTKYLESPA